MAVNAGVENTLAPDMTPERPIILMLGDSLTAGYNLPQGHAVPDYVQKQLRDMGRYVRVVNGGVSGDTSAGGLARLPWMLQTKPDLAIVELGANDALRGLHPNQTEQNLSKILEELHNRDIPTILAGMRAPPNMGSDYVHTFDAIYPKLAKKWRIPLIPFFLEGVITTPTLLQKDGMHPNEQGAAAIAKYILPWVIDALPKPPPA